MKSVGQNFHRISRMNRKTVLLIGLLTDLRGYLAAVQWLAPDMCCYCFWSRRFFFVGLFLSHRFHRYTQIFYGISGESLCPIPGGYLQRPNRSPPRNSVSSDEKKICVICEICVTKKTSQEKSVYICEICGTFSTLRGYLFFVGLFCPTDFTDIHRFFMDSLVNPFVRSQGVSATTEQVASAKIRE